MEFPRCTFYACPTTQKGRTMHWLSQFEHQVYADGSASVWATGCGDLAHLFVQGRPTVSVETVAAIDLLPQSRDIAARVFVTPRSAIDRGGDFSRSSVPEGVSLVNVLHRRGLVFVGLGAGCQRLHQPSFGALAPACTQLMIPDGRNDLADILFTGRVVQTIVGTGPQAGATLAHYDLLAYEPTSDLFFGVSFDRVLSVQPGSASEKRLRAIDDPRAWSQIPALAYLKFYGLGRPASVGDGQLLIPACTDHGTGLLELVIDEGAIVKASYVSDVSTNGLFVLAATQTSEGPKLALDLDARNVSYRLVTDLPLYADYARAAFGEL